MPQRSTPSSLSSEFNTSPRTLNTLPLVASPTGTVMGPPVSRTSWPRTRPSVGFRAIARTRSSPKCWATSRVKTLVSPPMVMSVCSALYIAGSASWGNSTSTTGPVTRATRPVVVAFVVAVFVISLSLSLLRRSEGVGAAHDFGNLLGNFSLASVVRQAGVFTDQLVGVVTGRLHRLLASSVFSRRGLQHGGEDSVLDVDRKQGIQNVIGLRLKLIQREHFGVTGLFNTLHNLEGEHSDNLRSLGDQRHKTVIDNVDFIHTALCLVCGELLDQGLSYF